MGFPISCGSGTNRHQMSILGLRCSLTRGSYSGLMELVALILSTARQFKCPTLLLDLPGTAVGCSTLEAEPDALRLRCQGADEPAGALGNVHTPNLPPRRPASTEADIMVG